MSTQLHVGKSRKITEAGSDGSTPGPLSANSNDPDTATATVDSATNSVVVTGINPGSCNITISAAGYQPDSEVFVVAALPTLVPTIGPEF